jgi:hypothetical protein
MNNLIDIMRNDTKTTKPVRKWIVSESKAAEIYANIPLSGITAYMRAEAEKLGTNRQTIYKAFKRDGLMVT